MIAWMIYMLQAITAIIHVIIHVIDITQPSSCVDLHLQNSSNPIF
jgi:hypothetical protein